MFAVITIHMLRGDRSGRSFYIKPRADVGCGPGVAPVLDTAAGGDGAAGRAKRMYFWLTEGDIGTAIHSLGRLKSLVKNPPSLAKRSGVPEAQLREIGAWIHAQAQPHAQQALRQQQHTSSAASASPSAASPSGFGPGSALTGLAQGTASMGEVLSRQAPASNCRTFSLADGRLAATSTVSATATALYRDRRLSMACPCNISVGATVLLKGTPVGGTAVEEATADLLMAATARAKVVAEECARKTVDRLGRQRVEELVCESLVEGVRSQRALAKADRAQRREQQRRQRAAAESQALIKKAVEHAALCTGSPSRRNKALPGEQLAAEAEWEAGSTGSGSAFGEATTSSSEEAIMHSPDSPVAPHRHIAPSTQHGHGVAPPPGAGRVTVDNLHTLLNAASLEAREQPADAPSTARSVSGKISIADLGDLLRPRPSPQ